MRARMAELQKGIFVSRAVAKNVELIAEKN
jgi:hypothetical protein